MGIAAYNRGSACISTGDARRRRDERRAMGLPVDPSDDVDRLPWKPVPRPEGWGAKASERARRAVKGLRAWFAGRSVDVSDDDLVSMVMEAAKCGRATAEQAVKEPL